MGNFQNLLNQQHNICTCDCYSVGSNLNVSNDSFNLIHINTCSANCNLDEFLPNIEKFSNKFNVIILTETFLISEVEWVETPGYLAHHSTCDPNQGAV